MPAIRKLWRPDPYFMTYTSKDKTDLFAAFALNSKRRVEYEGLTTSTLGS